MAFAVTPAAAAQTAYSVSPAAAAAVADFSVAPVAPDGLSRVAGAFLQFRQDGIGLGDRRVAVIDFVGDVTVTRGVGANAHVVTVRRASSITRYIAEDGDFYIAEDGDFYTPD